jgi:hypothetical protein
MPLWQFDVVRRDVPGAVFPPPESRRRTAAPAALCAEPEGHAEGLPVVSNENTALWRRIPSTSGSATSRDAQVRNRTLLPLARERGSYPVPALPRSARDCGAAPSGRGLARTRRNRATRNSTILRYQLRHTSCLRADAVAAVDVAHREGVLPGSLRRVQPAQPIARRGLRRFGVLAEGTANSAAAKENQDAY